MQWPYEPSTGEQPAHRLHVPARRHSGIALVQYRRRTFVHNTRVVRIALRITRKVLSEQEHTACSGKRSTDMQHGGLRATWRCTKGACTSPPGCSFQSQDPAMRTPPQPLPGQTLHSWPPSDPPASRDCSRVGRLVAGYAASLSRLRIASVYRYLALRCVQLWTGPGVAPGESAMGSARATPHRAHTVGMAAIASGLAVFARERHRAPGEGDAMALMPTKLGKDLSALAGWPGCGTR